MMKITRRSLLAVSAGVTLPVVARPAFGRAEIKVAAAHASPVENAWNSRLHSALKEAAAEGKIEYVFSETIANTDYPRALRQYAEAGAQLIVGESYAVEREARQVAKDYPKIAFLMGSSGKPDGENFGVFGTWNHEASYLTGILAGYVSKTGTFGSVGGYPVPEVNRLINAFRLGVKENKPDAKFLVSFIGTWFDPAKAKEQGIAQIEAGADVLFGERIGTADAAKERGKLSIGSLLDYSPRYPGVVFANAIWYFGPILGAALADVAGGKPTGRDYSEYSLMAHGGNDIIFDASLVPAPAVTAIEAKRSAIKSGSLKVAVEDRRPS